MNSQTTTSYVINSVERFNTPSDTNFKNAETYSEKHQTTIADLYYKYEDEPDFDCEFLINSEEFAEQENIDELESEDYIDNYGDDKWDADIYDPYLESTYF
ncbi:hypothetical protein [Flavobacterium reichenbachii]|uniref:Uncharacterized protein n=1 Tax=Flavobacterium reichenbachii TaxID=362418 RepID=A0A085ZEL8_9FLAO|nr:hypothetical protein [Flavobacterium reichenbachii]KFF02882.1 hypothetical protein IW19_22235 [Flavobacterium reichenbachii]OXB16875.1 hypothetical protein B0A68_05425 [Flavobacterium reichenbachii]